MTVMKKRNAAARVITGLSLLFIVAVVWLAREINGVKIENMKLELLLMSDWDDYSRSFVIFQRLKNLSENSGRDDRPGDERLILEAKYESVILNSNYRVFPDVLKGRNFMERFVRAIDRLINPELYRKIAERALGSEKYMEYAFFLEMNKNYSEAIRYYTVFLEQNRERGHIYHHIARLHLAFCYLMSGYPDIAESLARIVLASSPVAAITESARYFLEYTGKLGLASRVPHGGEPQGYPVETGIRHYSRLNFNRAIIVLGNYLASVQGGHRGDLLRALYYLGRSYEETGRFGQAADIYRKVLELKGENAYRDKAMKRLLIMHYVYRVTGEDVGKIITGSTAGLDGSLVREMRELSLMGKDLPGKRKFLLESTPAIEDEVKHLSAGGKPPAGTVRDYFDTYSADALEWPGKEETVLKGIERVKHIISVSGPGQARTMKVRIYLKDSSILLGDLEERGRGFMGVRIFGSRVNVKNDYIIRWEEVK